MNYDSNRPFDVPDFQDEVSLGFNAVIGATYLLDSSEAYQRVPSVDVEHPIDPLRPATGTKGVTKHKGSSGGGNLKKGSQTNSKKHSRGPPALPPNPVFSVVVEAATCDSLSKEGSHVSAKGPKVKHNKTGSKANESKEQLAAQAKGKDRNRSEAGLSTSNTSALSTLIGPPATATNICEREKEKEKGKDKVTNIARSSSKSEKGKVGGSTKARSGSRSGPPPPPPPPLV